MSDAIRRAVYKRVGGHCFYCARPLHANFHIDHGVAKKQRGSESIWNLYPACRGCNTLKRARTIDEFRTFLRIEAFFGELPEIAELAIRADVEIVEGGQVARADLDAGWELWVRAARFQRQYGNDDETIAAEMRRRNEEGGDDECTLH